MSQRSKSSRDPAAVWIFWAAYVVAIVGAVLVLDSYGGGSFWPELVAGFGASLAAFVLALSWESEKERRRLERDAATLRDKRERETRELEARLATEVRRRFEPVKEELRRNKKSLEMLAEAFDRAPAPGTLGELLHPELLDGAWSANAPRLTQLVADYALTSNLASTYGRIEELRWRLRQRTDALAGSAMGLALASALNTITKPLVAELLVEVTNLLERVAAQIEDPDVQPLGLLHVDAATVNLRLTVSAGSADDPLDPADSAS